MQNTLEEKMDVVVQDGTDCQIKINNLVKLENDYARKVETERASEEMGAKFNPHVKGVPEQFPQGEQVS